MVRACAARLGEDYFDAVDDFALEPLRMCGVMEKGDWDWISLQEVGWYPLLANRTLEVLHRLLTEAQAADEEVDPFRQDRRLGAEDVELGGTKAEAIDQAARDSGLAVLH